MDFKQGDVVIYSVHGICNITFVGDVEINHQVAEYYILESCNKASTKFYIPKDNALAVSKIRKVLTASQLEELLSAVNERADSWVENEILRKEHYKTLLYSENYENKICMIRTLHHHQEQLLSSGKKVHVCDEKFMKTAEQLISSEVAHVLNTTQEKAEDYIRSKLTE